VPESTSIADLVIKLGIDASGVQSGLQSAAAATRAFKDKIKPTMYGGFDPSALKAEMDAAAAISRIVQKKNEEKEASTLRSLAAQKAAEQEASYARTRLLVQEQLTFQRNETAKVSASRHGLAAQKAASQEASYARTRLLVQEQLTFERDQAAKVSASRHGLAAQKAASQEASYARTRLLVQEQLTFERDQAAKLRMIKEVADAQKAAVQAQITANQPSIANFASQYQSINEERSAQAAAVVAARRARDIADAARMKVAATKAERDYANSLRQAEAATRSVMTIEERFRAERERLIRLAIVMNNQTGQYVLSATSLNRALTNLTISTIRQQQAQRATNIVMNQGADAARIMTGVMGQASFAAEDFIQGMVFGDVRSALLGASNNLTMVVRGLIQVNAAGGAAAAGIMGTVYALGAAAAAAIAFYAIYRTAVPRAAMDERSLTEAINAGTEALIRRRAEIMRGAVLDAEQAALDLKRMKDAEALRKKLEDQELELKRKQEEARTNQARVSDEGDKAVTNALGGLNAEAEMTTLLTDAIAQGGQEAVVAQAAMAAYTEARRAAMAGESRATIDALRDLHDYFAYLQSIRAADDNFFSPMEQFAARYDDPTALDALQTMFNTSNLESMVPDLQRIEELEKIMLANGNSMLEIEAAKKTLMDAMEEGKKKLLELEEKEIQNALLIKQGKEATLDAQREETTFLLRATEVQKELLRIKKEQQEYMGGDVGPPTLAQAMEQAAAGIEFLQAQKDALVKEMHKAIPEVKGGLEQNTFSAQAKAFEQMQKKPDEQQKKMVELLASINQALANGGHILLVP